MKIDELLASAREAVTVKRVFGEPYEKDGITVIPAASVLGSGGGGGGSDDEGEEGGGVGFHARGRPVGAYVIKDDELAWVPALDQNRLIATVGAVAVVALLVWVKAAKIRAKAAGRARG